MFQNVLFSTLKVLPVSKSPNLIPGVADLSRLRNLCRSWFSDFISEQKITRSHSFKNVGWFIEEEKSVLNANLQFMNIKCGKSMTKIEQYFRSFDEVNWKNVVQYNI
jgi:hypothetical protein